MHLWYVGSKGEIEELADDFIGGEYIPFQDSQQQESSLRSPLTELAQNTPAEPPAKKKGTDVHDSCSF